MLDENDPDRCNQHQVMDLKKKFDADPRRKTAPRAEHAGLVALAVWPWPHISTDLVRPSEDASSCSHTLASKAQKPLGCPVAAWRTRSNTVCQKQWLRHLARLIAISIRRTAPSRGQGFPGPQAQAQATCRGVGFERGRRLGQYTSYRSGARPHTVHGTRGCFFLAPERADELTWSIRNRPL